MTGDVKSSPDSQIVVLTQEILRNRLFKIGSPSEAIGPSADLSLLQLGAVVMVRLCVYRLSGVWAFSGFRLCLLVSLLRSYTIMNVAST